MHYGLLVEAVEYRKSSIPEACVLHKMTSQERKHSAERRGCRMRGDKKKLHLKKPPASVLSSTHATLDVRWHKDNQVVDKIG